MEMPKAFELGFVTMGANGWEIDPEAPEDVKKEFEEFMKLTSGEPDEKGIITDY